jgi:hypothetical protein
MLVYFRTYLCYLITCILQLNLVRKNLIFFRILLMKALRGFSLVLKFLNWSFNSWGIVQVLWLAYTTTKQLINNIFCSIRLTSSNMHLALN